MRIAQLYFEQRISYMNLAQAPAVEGFWLPVWASYLIITTSIGGRVWRDVQPTIAFTSLRHNHSLAIYMHNTCMDL